MDTANIRGEQEVPVMCEICGNMVKNKHNLTSHVRIIPIYLSVLFPSIDILQSEGRINRMASVTS